MSNHVTYSIALIPENAGLIEQLNQLILGDDYTSESPKKSKPSNPPAKSKPKAEEPTIDFAEFKEAAKAAKAEHGEDFVKEVITNAGIDEASTLLKTVSAVPVEMYEGIMSDWKAGPSDEDKDEEDSDDDWDEDEEEEVEIDAQTVKDALVAYGKENSRDEAKEIMAKHKVASLAKVKDLSPTKLKKLMADLV